MHSVFISHLRIAHLYWKEILDPEDTAIDATCGNGKDLFYLAELLPRGRVIGIDIQKKAIEKTEAEMPAHLKARITLFWGSHVTFPLEEQGVKLIVYNLGYLPGGDKSLTTSVETTLASVEEALKRIVPGGAVSIMCYPGHPEGFREEMALVEKAALLSDREWSVTYLKRLNRSLSPSLLFIQKKNIYKF